MKPLLAYVRFIRDNYQSIIIAAVVLGLGLGLWTTAPGKVLQSWSQGLMFLMILCISLTIIPRDLVLVVRQPAVVGAGLALNFLFMPVVCWVLARLLVSDSQLATGVILVGVVPCAGMAAVWTALLKGDVALVMVVESLTMILAPFLIPPLMELLAGSGVQVNALKMFQQLVVILLVPLILGMAGRMLLEKRWTEPRRVMPVFAAFSATVAVLIMFAVCNVNVPLIVARWDLVLPLLPAVALIFPLGFLVPHWVGKPFFNREQGIAVTYSSGMKNLPIAAGLAFTSFSQLAGLPVVLAFIIQMLTASTFYRFVRREGERRVAPDLAADPPNGRTRRG
jgi:predicted Na+-dependent transporter